MSNTDRLKSLVRERLGDAYTVEIGESVARVSRKFAETRYQLSQQAMNGEIDSETFAIRLNEAASDAIAELRPILGKRFDDVVGMDESFMLADPAIAKEIDYTQVPEDVLLTPDNVIEVLANPICVDILHHLSNQSLDVEALAKKLQRSPKELPDLLGLLGLLQGAQLVAGQTEKSVTMRVRQVPAVHGKSYSLLITDDSGVERSCGLSLPTGMDRELTVQLERELTALWTYSCLADLKSPCFNDEEAGRGGVMNIKAYVNSLGGIDAAIEAERHWFVTRDGKQTDVKPVKWHSKGGVSVSFDGISFDYRIDSEFGSAKDSYLITAGPLRELNGTFVHTRTDGEKVRGTVRLLKQGIPEPSDAISPKLAPSGP